MDNKIIIHCPNCMHEIHVDEVYSRQAEEKLRSEYERKLMLEKKQLSDREGEFRRKEEELEAARRGVSEEVRRRLEKEKSTLSVSLEAELRERYAADLSFLTQKIEKREKENKELKEKELQFLMKENEINERQNNIELEIRRKVAVERERMENDLLRKKDDLHELEIRQKQKQIDDMKSQVDEMKKRMEQGSVQAQGETLELAMEEFLKRNFPFDTISDIGKGVKGGDILHYVNEKGADCGVIYYESKRTKHFSNEWISKFKEDMRARGADIGVIVTETMPKDMPHLGEKERVWICSFTEFKGVCFLLRQMLVSIHETKQHHSNRESKMEMLYSYLTSNEFRLTVEGIVEGFTTMQINLEKEKRAMYKQWSEREKQLEKVIMNTTRMYGSLRGIAGNQIGTISSLELGEGDE